MSITNNQGSLRLLVKFTRAVCAGLPELLNTRNPQEYSFLDKVGITTPNPAIKKMMADVTNFADQITGGTVTEEKLAAHFTIQKRSSEARPSRHMHILICPDSSQNPSSVQVITMTGRVINTRFLPQIQNIDLFILNDGNSLGKILPRLTANLSNHLPYIDPRVIHRPRKGPNRMIKRHIKSSLQDCMNP